MFTFLYICKHKPLQKIYFVNQNLMKWIFNLILKKLNLMMRKTADKML